MLILASASPRRAELLRAAGIEFDVVIADIDESMLPGEAPETFARRVAEAKARAVLPKAGTQPVLAADTVVVIDGLTLGKPIDIADARRMLELLSGREHQVLTAVCLAWGASPSGPWQFEMCLDSTTVSFSRLTEAEIEAYIATGEPVDKAGAYAIQGRASRFIPRISGSYTNVVGLPVAVVSEMLKRADLNQPR